MVVFISKSYLVLIQVRHTMMGDGHFMCVTSQVFNYLFGTTERFFGIHVPLLETDGGKQFVEGKIFHSISFFFSLRKRSMKYPLKIFCMAPMGKRSCCFFFLLAPTYPCS